MMTSVVEIFLKLVTIDSPTGEEQEFAKYLMGLLENLGLKPKIDSYNNVFVKLSGEGDPVFLNAHIDTVEPGRSILPLIDGGVIRSRGKTILGADNKVSVAAILFVLSKIQTEKLPHRPVEILFTTSEEIGNYGALGFDTSKLNSKLGFIFDKEGDIGEIISCSPYYARFNLRLVGQSAHAAHRQNSTPVIELMIKILSDVEKLRTDDLLINTGLINGGTARNTVMGDVAIKGEIRSYSKGLFYNAVKKVEKLKELSYEQLQVHAEIVVENPGYVHDKSDLEKVSSYLESIIGMKFIPSASYGCSDANIFNDNKIGLKVYNLSDGSYKHHTVDEYATVDNLNNLADIIFSIMTAKSNNLK